ncbi:MAG: hypothetical protein H6613_20665 [Ignavibacteriales bacterium]|nr:hypothetical protein [Ignavibacteriales bacterium]
MGFFFGLNADCGCFGNAIKSDFGWGMILRNTLLLLITIYISYFMVKSNKNERNL